MELYKTMKELIHKADALERIKNQFIFHTDGKYTNEDREVNDFHCVWDFIEEVKGLQRLVYDIDLELWHRQMERKGLEDYK